MLPSTSMVLTVEDYTTQQNPLPDELRVVVGGTEKLLPIQWQSSAQVTVEDAFDRANSVDVEVYLPEKFGFSIERDSDDPDDPTVIVLRITDDYARVAGTDVGQVRSNPGG